MNASTVSRLAAAFAGKLRDAFTDKEWEEMRSRNAAPVFAGSCASHDFCDANMVMAASFLELLGRDLTWQNDDGSHSPESEADFTLWNSAWDEARREYLTNRPEERSAKPH